MSKFKLVIVAFVLSSTFSFAQEIGISIGYGSYQMDDLKMLNVQTDPLIPTKLVDDFPPFLRVGAHMIFNKSKNFALGGQIGFQSTGSRMSYADYSGSYSFDQSVQGLDFSGIPAFIFLNDGKNFVMIDAELGVTVTFQQMESTLQIGDVYESEGIKFKSLNFFAEPGLRYKRALGESPFSIAARASYNSNFVKGKLMYSENEEAYLTVNGRAAHADWSGYRLEILVSYDLQKKK